MTKIDIRFAKFADGNSIIMVVENPFDEENTQTLGRSSLTHAIITENSKNRRGIGIRIFACRSAHLKETMAILKRHLNQTVTSTVQLKCANTGGKLKMFIDAVRAIYITAKKRSEFNSIESRLLSTIALARANLSTASSSSQIPFVTPPHATTRTTRSGGKSAPRNTSNSHRSTTLPAPDTSPQQTQRFYEQNNLTLLLQASDHVPFIVSPTPTKTALSVTPPRASSRSLSCSLPTPESPSPTPLAFLLDPQKKWNGKRPHTTSFFTQQPVQQQQEMQDQRLQTVDEIPTKRSCSLGGNGEN